MKTLRYVILLALLSAALVYAGGDHDHSEDAHERAAETKADDTDDGHAHEADEGESRAVTLWTDKMELFMEYPVLTANKPGRFIIHLTILDGFQPVRDGTVKLSFVTPDGHSHDVVETKLLREGIFTPTVELRDIGNYEFALVYNGPGVRDSFNISGFAVYASADQVPHSEEVASSEEISFLKEQQWKIPFATTEAETREVKRAVWAIGDVLPSPNAYVEIVSPVDGIVHVGESGRLALPGSIVKRGASVATITPPVQGQGWASSRLAYEQAKRDYERAQRLKERQAISEREFEQTRDDYLAMKAGFESVSGGGENGTLELHAPISGKIIEWQVSPGQRVNAGDKLMAIVDPATVWLRVNVYENDFRSLGQPVGAFVKADGAGGGWAISDSEMKVLTTGGAFDPITRTVPVLLEVSNQSGRLRVHESTPVELYASDGISSTAVPKSALYEDEGMDVIFVQSGGESFEKRIVQVGPHHNGWVAITHGLAPGERVVTTGGYQVKLAASSAEIGHGHAH
ncbi:MAG: efflux RND transporter periplasmic adaptor subunit [Bacteroidetes bacterium]|nr:efflux RND transporter periplasmic adaptor subunit [Bacteroidota bacterium]